MSWVRKGSRGKGRGLLFATLGACLIAWGCAGSGGSAPNEATASSDSARIREAYYLNVAGNSEPPQLVDEVSRREALAQRSYFRAQFDASGALAALSKFRGGERLFRTEYRYHPNGKVREARVMNRDGAVTLRRFDEQGRSLPGPDSP